MLLQCKSQGVHWNQPVHVHPMPLAIDPEMLRQQQLVAASRLVGAWVEIPEGAGHFQHKRGGPPLSVEVVWEMKA